MNSGFGNDINNGLSQWHKMVIIEENSELNFICTFVLIDYILDFDQRARADVFKKK